MLAQSNRITSHGDFIRVTKSPIRSTTKSLVGYLIMEPELQSPKVGFIVSRAIGGSVVRHQVTRQLRHATRDSLERLPKNAMVVIRALKRDKDTRIEIPTLFESLANKASNKAAK